MALEDILEAFREETAEEIRRIEQGAEAEIGSVMKTAYEEAESVERAAASALDARLAAESEVVKSRAVLNMERRLREARESLYQEVLSRARDRLARHRRSPEYRDTLHALLGECAAFLPDGSVIHADDRDVDLVREVASDLVPSAEIDPSLSTWGGVELTNGRGALVRNTLEARFDRAGAELRRRVGDIVPGLREASPA